MGYICAMPLVTFTSDLGLQHHALASIKGKLFSAFSNINVVDIAHHIAPFNLQQTTYIFKQTYRHFPLNTFHFVFNDLFADSKRQLLYVYENKQHIFCADNGFLTMLFDDQPIQIFKLDENVNPYNLLTVADAFVLHALMLEQGNKMGLINIDVNDIVVQKPNKAFYANDAIEAQIMHIDGYGNVVLNVTQQQFDELGKGRSFRILFMRDDVITKLSSHYNDVALGRKLCLFNTAGYLEIAVNKGNAAELFGFQESNERSLFYNNIKIFFE